MCDDDDDDDAVWEGLVPLHVEKIVDPLVPTFEFQLYPKSDNINYNELFRTFSIFQDLEGRRKPATIPTATEESNDENDHDTAIAKEGLTEQKSKTGAVLWDGAVVAAGILDKVAKTLARAAALENRGFEISTMRDKQLLVIPSLLDLKGKTVLELGCGCAALSGMVALALGAKHVFLTDLEPIIESEVLATNLTNNLTEDERSNVTKLVYRWGDDQFDPYRDGSCRGVSLILACDTVYDMALVEPLLDSIFFIMRKSNDFHGNKSCCKALVCYDESIGRNKAYRYFREEAKKRFAVVQELTESEKRHDLRPDSVRALIIMHPIENKKKKDSKDDTTDKP